MNEQIITLFAKVWIVWMSSTVNIILHVNKKLQIFQFKWVLFLAISWKFGQSALLPKLTTDSLSQIRLTVQAEEHWLGLAGLDLNIWIDCMNMY